MRQHAPATMLIVLPRWLPVKSTTLVQPQEVSELESADRSVRVRRRTSTTTRSLGIVTERGGRVVKHIGDGALSAFDGPVPLGGGISRGRHGAGHRAAAGVHTGECEAIGQDLGGLAVPIGARVGRSRAGRGGRLLHVKELVVGSVERPSTCAGSDRVTVALARRAPRAMRLGARLASRSAQPT